MSKCERVVKHLPRVLNFQAPWMPLYNLLKTMVFWVKVKIITFLFFARFHTSTYMSIKILQMVVVKTFVKVCTGSKHSGAFFKKKLSNKYIILAIFLAIIYRWKLLLYICLDFWWNSFTHMESHPWTNLELFLSDTFELMKYVAFHNKH